MLVYDRNGVRVYEVDGEFVVADDSGWRDGVFSTVAEAVSACSGEVSCI